MACIQHDFGGKAPVLILSDTDRELLKDAVKRKKTEGVTASELARKVGVGRTYFYALLDSNQLEIKRYSIIKEILGINLLSNSDINDYLDNLRELLS